MDDETNKHKYTVTVETKIAYDLEVEAESFNHAAEQALDKAQEIERLIAEAADNIVPEGILAWVDTTTHGVHKQG